MFCGDDPIALAGRPLETGAIDDFQRAPRFPHGAAALQLVQGRRYPGSPHAKHHGQEIMGERNGVAVEPVMGQKQQSRQTFHERVAGVAQDRLRLLDEQCVHIIHQLLAQSRASPSIARRKVSAPICKASPSTSMTQWWGERMTPSTTGTPTSPARPMIATPTWPSRLVRPMRTAMPC